MVPQRLLPYLLALGLWLLIGCTPGPGANTPIAGVELAPSPTTSVPATATQTTTPTPMTSPPTPTLPTPTDTATVYQSPTPTHTATPKPTFTPIPGPVWPILFSGVPCPAGYAECSNDLFMSQSSRWYLINSDGSGLIALEALGVLPADFRSYPRFSLDGTRLAYLHRLGGEESHIILANADGSNPIDLGRRSDDFRDLGFLPETDCLAVLIVPPRTFEGERVTIEKVCVGQSEREVLDIVEFPGPYFYRLSPQGDALLAYGQSSTGGTSLYVHEIGSSVPPRLLFSQSGFPALARWHSDSRKIEFTLGMALADEMRSTTFYVMERDGEALETRLSITTEFAVAMGDWSPDGRELAFLPGLPDLPPERSGIYILDLASGEWRQILSEFYVTLIQTWEGGIP